MQSTTTRIHRYYHPACYAQARDVPADRAWAGARHINGADLDRTAAISVPHCAHCGRPIIWRDPVVDAWDEQ